jgi:hypothetical protein
MPNGAQNLGSQLGQLIFGRPDDNKAYYQGQVTGALVGDRMASARKNRAEAMIDEDTYTNRQVFDGKPLLDPNATLEQRAEALRVGALANLGSNLSSGMDAYSKGRGQERIDAAEQAFRGGNTALGNMLLAASDGKPLETTSVTDGTAFNKYDTPDQTMNVTDVGNATIGLRHAQAGAANAAAGEHAANTRLADTKTEAGGFAPDRGDTKPTRPTSAPITMLGALLGKVGTDGNPPEIPAEKLRQFLAWQAGKANTDQRYLDGDFAMQRYASEAPLGSGVHDAPSDVGAVDLSKLGETLVKGGAPSLTQAPAPSPAPAPARKVVRTGTAPNGRKVVQFDDGTVDYAD